MVAAGPGLTLRKYAQTFLGDDVRLHGLQVLASSLGSLKEFQRSDDC